MGQFSWIYSDTKEQLINNHYADAYLLVPEPFQEKYGKSIHEACVKYGTQDDGSVDYVKGANIDGLMKVATAMLEQGTI